jgi:hypothetical protein
MLMKAAIQCNMIEGDTMAKVTDKIHKVVDYSGVWVGTHPIWSPMLLSNKESVMDNIKRTIDSKRHIEAEAKESVLRSLCR